MSTSPATTATVAATRVSRAGAMLAAGGLASSGFVIWRLVETWHVTPAAASHRISVLGYRLTYPSANLGAMAVLALALLGLIVTVMTVRGAVRELVTDGRLRRWLRAHEVRRRGVTRVIEDERPRAFCAGLLRPCVYVSTGTLALLDDAALHAVLEHELAHARRRDPLRLACGRVLAQALVMIPGLGELHRQHVALAELSADESAIEDSPGNRAALARAMLRFAEHSRPEDPTGLDPARVDHLLGDSPGWRFPLLVFLAGLSVLGLLTAVGVLASRIAAGSATLAPPLLSRQPCVVMLAAIPALAVAIALTLGRRGSITGRPGS